MDAGRASRRHGARRTGTGRSGDLGSDAVDELEEQQVGSEVAIADEGDVAVDLLDGVLVVSREIGGDADQSRGGPILEWVEPRGWGRE